MKLVLWLLCSVAAFGQVNLMVTPEPMEVLKPINVQKVGLWTCRACNVGGTAMVIPPERLLMAVPELNVLTPEQAWLIITDRRQKSPKLIVIQLIEYGAMIAAAATGFGAVAASTTVVGSIALGIATANQVKTKLQSEGLPDLAMFKSTALTDTLVLAPGQCATRSLFAAKVRNPRTIQAVIK